MKKFILTTSAIAALLAAGITGANAGNSASVYQSGKYNTGVYTQNGYYNKGAIHTDGRSNHSTAVQHGEWNYLYQQQLGNRNTALTDIGRASCRERVESAVADVALKRNGNEES